MADLVSCSDNQNSKYISAKHTFIATRRAFTELEAMGASDFDIFNALSDLFYQRNRPEISELMAEAAYRIYQSE
jgi:hypothetical protein